MEEEILQASRKSDLKSHKGVAEKCRDVVWHPDLETKGEG